MRISWIDHDSWCQDFNFPEGILGGRPSHKELCQYVVEARSGSRLAAKQFGDVMHWTLRLAAYECYLRVRPSASLTYADWFYSKLRFFLRILLDGNPAVPYMDRPLPGMFRVPDYSDALLELDLETLAKPEDNNHFNWGNLVRAVAEDSDDRDGTLRRWFQQQRQEIVSKASVSPAKAHRNTIVLATLAAGKSRREVCEALDRDGIPTTREMAKAGIHRWTLAWEDSEFKPNVQTMISKVISLGEAVKTSRVST